MLLRILTLFRAFDKLPETEPSVIAGDVYSKVGGETVCGKQFEEALGQSAVLENAASERDCINA